MLVSRRQLLVLTAGAAPFTAVVRVACAQAYPSRPVHIVVGFGAGSGLDLYARIIGQWLSDRIGQPVIIDNRPGAGTNIATESVVNSPPDGYTLLMASTAAFTNPALRFHPRHRAGGEPQPWRFRDGRQPCISCQDVA
jgi:tripartite-type tricarboxylate transporter receptor subunit TctC